MTDLSDLNQFLNQIKIMMAVMGGLSTLCTVAGVWAVLKFRVNRLDKEIFGNGSSGLITQVQKHREHCAAMHKKEVPS